MATKDTAAARADQAPYPGETLEAVLKAARIANPTLELDHGRTFAFVPEGFALKDVSDPYALPPYIKQGIVMDERDSLVGYVHRFSDDRTVLIADYDRGEIRAALDYHAENNGHTVVLEPGQEIQMDDWVKARGAMMALDPGPVKHIATLKLRDSEEFTRWAKMQGQLVEQSEFAAFLEENSEDISDPDPAVMIEISRDLEATQGVMFKSSNRLESGDRAFIYETETRTRGEMKIPREFRLSIPLYQGEEPVTLRCAFRFRIGGGGLLLGFEWRRVEYQRQAYFGQIAHAIAEDTGRPLFIGRLSG
ncbi:MAG: hypothetical protein HLUCCA12_12055 [Rhodobacteraceae bacterium HLUCCA12]|nr:MAG: hypothetical protein HLUCCA12_12055 [Rhodobacteraceae bacterium HLUCCA12]